MLKSIGCNGKGVVGDSREIVVCKEESEIPEGVQLNKGKAMLEEVALCYAGDHGLRPDTLEWDNQGYQWTLKVIDSDHTVRVVFSPDEIAMFADDLPENRETKSKVRNAFASLSM